MRDILDRPAVQRIERVDRQPTPVIEGNNITGQARTARASPSIRTLRGAAKRGMLSGNGGRGAMLTREFMLGLNLLTLAGFLLMGVGLTLTRQRAIGAPLAFTLMTAGTALVFVGLYLAPTAMS